MKYKREIKVGILVIICTFLLIFGFNYLKGVNIFSSVRNYHGRFVVLNGLTEQAPVFIRGYKVGQVNRIRYDFALDSAFIIDVSINQDIHLPCGTEMALVPNGLLSGTAVELRIPAHDASAEYYDRGDFLPTIIVPGLMQTLEDSLLASLNATVLEAKDFIAGANRQLADDHLHHALANIDSISGELTTTSHALKQLMAHRVPSIAENIDTTVYNFRLISADIRNADIPATIARVDTAVDHVNYILADMRDGKGTLGKLLYDHTLYDNVNTTVRDADSLLVDLKAHPKRYVHFSVFGRKDK